MDHVHLFDAGGWLLFLAYFTSVAGSTVGLACTLQARYSEDTRARLGWTSLAAVSIGGVGIWLMHFVAMVGFSTPGHPVRYNVGLTALSAVLAVAAVFGGLLVFGARRNFMRWRLALGGLITGAAVILMHYTGMAAVEIKGTISYAAWIVELSIVIAVAAATVALWFTVTIDRRIFRVLAGAVMGVAVTGMHYTGMLAMQVHIDMSAPDPTGVEAFDLLFPVFILGGIALVIPVCATLIAPPVLELEERVRLAD